MIKEKKKPTTLKGWQKLYPDAIKITAEAQGFLSDTKLVYIAFGKDAVAKVLQNTSSGSWSSKNGAKVMNRAVVSKMAANQNDVAERSVATEVK